ncbi:deoxyuridine 5 -triphosphate nucleotidohydrolase [Olea europaea subsp. europaea]|uniref:Deoxyuridine 5'-triphosphate nucleotidohydrolase n=1 Tax=Olea europaea subsp. europaea TaxID=158383 RepID=A0A8S0TIA3_OLEEU|nr:deoxyuridine 5 -triphosphate nucleotidohydrolase [Olea europaea subsp. europaea]
MAGILGAISLQSLFYLILTIWHLQSMKIEIPLRCKSTTSQSRKIFSLAFRMAQAVETQNGNPEIKEPTPKIQKLHNNGVSHEIVSFLRVKKLSDKASLPSRASLLSAGYDLSSATETKVPARGKALIPTDLSIAIPERTYARIAPRSGLAWKHSIDVGAGVIDADYRGPVGVILFNHSDVDFEVKTGDRIAQLIIQKIETPEVTEVDDLDSTVRGSGGFGSTGV